MTRLLIVDDHPLFREALRSALELVQEDAEIFEATSIEGAIDVIAAHDEFDLALLDLTLPGTTGFSGLVRIRATYPKLPVVIVSGHESADLVRQAISLGVAGYIPKSTSKKELAFAIGQVLKGSIFVPSQFASVGEASEPEADVRQVLKRLKTLTPQQLLVLDMIREGLQNKQIAHELRIAETTVKAHVSEVLRKLRVYTRTKAVIEIAKVDFSVLLRRGDGREGFAIGESAEKIGH
jgi:DNA-binding NarL/FixJ family response regulator